MSLFFWVPAATGNLHPPIFQCSGRRSHPHTNSWPYSCTQESNFYLAPPLYSSIWDGQPLWEGKDDRFRWTARQGSWILNNAPVWIIWQKNKPPSKREVKNTLEVWNNTALDSTKNLSFCQGLFSKKLDFFLGICDNTLNRRACQGQSLNY